MICDRPGDDFSTAVQAETLSRPEQGVKVRGRPTGEVVRRQPVDLGERTDDAGDVGRLVPLPTIWDRRKKGTVCLRQQALDGHTTRGLPQLRGLRKRDDAGERNMEPE